MNDSPTSKQALADQLESDMRAQGSKIIEFHHSRVRTIIEALRAADEPKAPTPADEADMNRIFDSWFDSLREPPQNYLQVFAAGYAAGMLRRPEPPKACTHPWEHVGINADGIYWCTECFAQLRVPSITDEDQRRVLPPLTKSGPESEDVSQ